jgi:hypothetical protein
MSAAIRTSGVVTRGRRSDRPERRVAVGGFGVEAVGSSRTSRRSGRGRTTGPFAVRTPRQLVGEVVAVDRHPPTGGRFGFGFSRHGVAELVAVECGRDERRSVGASRADGTHGVPSASRTAPVARRPAVVASAAWTCRECAVPLLTAPLTWRVPKQVRPPGISRRRTAAGRPRRREGRRRTTATPRPGPRAGEANRGSSGSVG